MRRYLPTSISTEVFSLIALGLLLGLALTVHQVIVGRTGLGLFFGVPTLLLGAFLCLVGRPRAETSPRGDESPSSPSGYPFGSRLS